jgi:hypothetical protein
MVDGPGAEDLRRLDGVPTHTSPEGGGIFMSAVRIAVLLAVALAVATPSFAQKPSLRVGGVELWLGMSKADAVKRFGDAHVLVDAGDMGFVAPKGAPHPGSARRDTVTFAQVMLSLWARAQARGAEETVQGQVNAMVTFKGDRIVKISRSRFADAPQADEYSLARMLFALFEEAKQRGDVLAGFDTTTTISASTTVTIRLIKMSFVRRTPQGLADSHRGFEIMIHEVVGYAPDVDLTEYVRE